MFPSRSVFGMSVNLDGMDFVMSDCDKSALPLLVDRCGRIGGSGRVGWSGRVSGLVDRGGGRGVCRGTFLLDDRIETVLVSGVLNNPLGAIGFHQTIVPFHVLSITVFGLAFHVTSVVIVDRVVEAVRFGCVFRLV